MIKPARRVSPAWTAADRSTRARSCHSLVVTIPAGQDAEAVRRRLELDSARWPDLSGAKLWEASVEGDDDWARLVTREARRPIGIAPSSLPLRLVLVQRASGGARLVIVAVRSCVPRALLFSLAADLCGMTDSHAGTSNPAVGEPVASRPVTAPPWGFGSQERTGLTGTITRVIEPVSRVDARALRAAVALVWSRYGPDEVRAAGIHHPHDGQTVSGFLAMFDRESSAECPAVRVVYQDPVPSGVSYLPFLSPVSPLTVIGNRQVDGSLEVVFDYDEGAVSAAVAGDFAAQTVQAACELVTVSAEHSLAAIGTAPRPETAVGLRASSRIPERPQSAPGQTIHQRFTEVAACRENAVAVSDGHIVLTYRDVEERAERIAAGLRSLGASAGDLIGVCLEPDATLIVALLAVLKCGCAYVPMDVRHPPERMRGIVTNAGIRIVIGDRFPETGGTRVVGLPQLEQDGQSAAPDGRDAAVQAGEGTDFAYIIYTSGSTGGPKGVVVPHSNVLALIDATARDFSLESADVWTMFHSSAFDFSVWEMWGCLLTGARLVVVPYWVTRSIGEFRELLVREKVTVLSQTPSAFSQLIMADRELPPDLAVRLVIFGGEPLDTRMLLPWLKRYSPAACRLVNMFGITETTVHATSHTVTPADVISGTRNVGRAIPGWEVSIRDSEGRVLPAGAPGEIWVSGRGVASHYLNRPELTAQRFVMDPASGKRCYRSGDLGRMRPDGSLDHLGRLDTQVKIRGYRIELDEIRGALLSEPQVSAAAAVVRHDVPGDPASMRIHAYVVLLPGTELTGILANLHRYLPDYMIPASLTAIDSLPLTVNGKLDAGRLPAPSTTALTVEPGNQAEGRDEDLTTRLLALWSQHLNTEATLDGNFFELGGNSLLVTRLLADLRKQGFPQISIRTFYQNSTARQFIDVVRQEIATSGSAGMTSASRR